MFTIVKIVGGVQKLLTYFVFLSPNIFFRVLFSNACNLYHSHSNRLLLLGTKNVESKHRQYS